MTNESLAADHKRCAISRHNAATTRRFDTPTAELVVMTEACYHATMAVLHQLKTLEES